MADNKIIFSMQGVGKIIPPNNKQILKDIYLSFFYGAKIGIIGSNGSGKSTLLKIIAGKDQQYQGKIQFEKDYSIGLLEQEPHLDDSKTVKEIVSEGVQDVMDMLKEFEVISNKFSEPMTDEEMDKLLQKQGTSRRKLRQ
jgi:ATPase subunit of ABC transporter with duplicated ATPase domains